MHTWNRRSQQIEVHRQTGVFPLAGTGRRF
jgi:hypothetical protein